MRHPARERRLRILVAQGQQEDADKLAFASEGSLQRRRAPDFTFICAAKMKHNHELCQRLAQRVSAP